MNLFRPFTRQASWTCSRCTQFRPSHSMFTSAVRRGIPSVRPASTVPPASQAARTMPTPNRERFKKRNQSYLYYTLSGILGVISLSYGSVPLYRALCQKTGFGGIPMTDQTRFTPDKLIPVKTARRLRVTFTSNVSDVLDWKFVPQQREVKVLPGETALAFYTATNMSDEDIIGVATYSVTPGGVAPYFSKIQCFCFEEQKLAAGETVDMPVFFFIDPDFLEDPQMKKVETVTLAYTFFKAKYDSKGELRPIPA